MDDARYHHRRAAQHRRMIAAGDPQYVLIHRQMVEMHEAKARAFDEAVAAMGSKMAASGP